MKYTIIISKIDQLEIQSDENSILAAMLANLRQTRYSLSLEGMSPPFDIDSSISNKIIVNGDITTAWLTLSQSQLIQEKNDYLFNAIEQLEQKNKEQKRYQCVGETEQVLFKRDLKESHTSSSDAEAPESINPTANIKH